MEPANPLEFTSCQQGPQMLDIESSECDVYTAECQACFVLVPPFYLLFLPLVMGMLTLCNLCNWRHIAFFILLNFTVANNQMILWSLNTVFRPRLLSNPETTETTQTLRGGVHIFTFCSSYEKSLL